MYDGMGYLAVFLVKMGLMNAGGVGLLCGWLAFREVCQDDGPVLGTVVAVLAVIAGCAGAIGVQVLVGLFFYALVIAW
jgi:hypothetical protein